MAASSRPCPSASAMKSAPAAAGIDSCEPSFSEWVDQKRVVISNALDPGLRKQLGQFMTPLPVARFMASMFSPAAGGRLLDAGAGMGSLCAAYVDAFREASVDTGRDIEITAVEIDAGLRKHLRSTLEECGQRCKRSGLALEARIVARDFLEYAVDEAGASGPGHGAMARFDAAILNPPYAKIGSASRHRKLLRTLGIEATNLYSAFIAAAIRLLKPGGQLVAITPRSFCNGPYFRAFREMLITETSLRRIHVYESRKDAFKDDAVLQENVIFHAVKGAPPPSHVLVTSSSSAENADLAARDVPYGQVVRAGDSDAFIHLPVLEEDRGFAEFVSGQACDLESLGLTVSTGRVVDFRARRHLRRQARPGCVPLIYPLHFHDGFVEWPSVAGRKPNAILAKPATESLLIPNATYVFTKRFTSKEERRRVVAAVYDPARLKKGRFPSLGVENHLNYFHADGCGLEPRLARGLAAYLNTTAVDRYFRQFSGHTQVNATDLRSLRYPDLEALRRIADRVGDRIDDPEAVDAAVAAEAG